MRAPGPRLGRPSAVVQFPDADLVLPSPQRPSGAVDVLLVNPPAPDGAIWIRSQHRVGRRSRENMIWPQVSLAQLAALLHPDHSVEIVDAIPQRMSWPAFERLLAEKRPRTYVTQVAAPTLTNDLRGTFLARALGARTIAFGPHVTPLPGATLEAFPSLDYVLRGEPELTLRELVDTLDLIEGRWGRGGRQRLPEGTGRDPELWARLERLFTSTDPGWQPPWMRLPPREPGISPHDLGAALPQALAAIKGLAWRRPSGEVCVNPDRPFMPDLDHLPLPLHHLLPWETYRAPNIRGPYTFVVPSRGCPAGCTFCIKHVTYGRSVRVRSPEHVLGELQLLWELGLRNVHMYADLFTVDRDQVLGLCQGMIDQGLGFRWTCNSRVDTVDPELLSAMARAGCWLISWGLESADETVRRQARKGITEAQIERALRWSKGAGIMNWGYFILGLPGETEETIRASIEMAKRLPLDLALFHIAAPYPGTPLYFQALEEGWIRPGLRWEEIDMDESAVLEIPGLPAERVEYWARRAFREWALRPGPLWTFVKSMNNGPALRSAVNAGWQALGWMR